ncbi:MAG: hypothetical protein ABFS28_11090, partial [Bacteroidota bacterium]
DFSVSTSIFAAIPIRTPFTYCVKVRFVFFLKYLYSELEGYETGADSFIGKPFLPRQLTTVIANLLKTRQRIKEYQGK